MGYTVAMETGLDSFTAKYGYIDDPLERETVVRLSAELASVGPWSPKPQTILKGEWFTFCCWRDMEQAAHDTRTDGYVPFRIYASLSAALEYELRPGQVIGEPPDDDSERRGFLDWLHAGPRPYYEGLRQAVLAECPELAASTA
jgi:hypothetical protein